MLLVWARLENETKPILLNASAMDENKDKTKNVLIRTKNKVHRAVICSSIFNVDDKTATDIFNHYGLIDYPKIIGFFEYKETMYEAVIHN